MFVLARYLWAADVHVDSSDYIFYAMIFSAKSKTQVLRPNKDFFYHSLQSDVCFLTNGSISGLNAKGHGLHSLRAGCDVYCCLVSLLVNNFCAS